MILLGLLSASTAQKPATAVPQQIISAPIPEVKPNPVVAPTPTEQKLAPASPITPVIEQTAPIEEEPLVTPIAAGDSDLWPQVVKQIQPLSAQALVSQHCRLLSFDGSLARVTITSQQLLKLAQNKIPSIEAAFQKLVPQKVKVVLEVGGESKPAPPLEQPRSPIFSPPPQPKAPELPVVKSPPIPENVEEVAAPIADLAVEVVDDKLQQASQSLAEAFKGEKVEFSLNAPYSSATSATIPVAQIASSAIAWEEEEEEEF